MNSCCEDEKNLDEPQIVKEDLVVRVCKICGNRHFELTVDPAHIGVKVY